jgi:hypothetical protein
VDEPGLIGHQADPPKAGKARADSRRGFKTTSPRRARNRDLSSRPSKSLPRCRQTGPKAA